MKACPLLALLALTVWSNGYAESPRETRASALRDTFRFNPVPLVEEPATPFDDSIIVLESLTITESMAKRAVAAQVEARRAKELADAFAWTRGGLLSSSKLGHFQADKGVWIELGDRTSGAQASREIFIKVEMLRLRW